MRILLVILFLAFEPGCHARAVQTSGQELVLTKTEVQQVINNTIAILGSDYLFEDKTPVLIERLKESLRSGDFDRHYQFGRLKQQLEVALYRASGDSNFELRQRDGLVSPLSTQTDDAPGTIESGVLEGHVGYIALNGDFSFTGAQTQLHRAVETVAGARAVIIDLRKVGLGSLSLTQQFLSYFFPPGTPLADIQFPKGKTQHLLSEALPAPVGFSPHVPVFLINSVFVTGPWELFGYTLKQYGRAVIVGEKTMGVAVMTELLPVSDNVRLRFSRAYLAHPVSKDNWQDWGVEADHDAVMKDSFARALELAVQSELPQEQAQSDGTE